MNTTTPVEVLATLGNADPIYDLTARRVGSDPGTIVLRHGDRDVIRASSRPYLIIEHLRLANGDVAWLKVSWHHSLAAARGRLDKIRGWRPRPGGTSAYAIIRGDRP